MKPLYVGSRSIIGSHILQIEWIYVYERHINCRLMMKYIYIYIYIYIME